jgi:CubicO group peptidase (beta-lactamase class C family)
MKEMGPFADRVKAEQAANNVAADAAGEPFRRMDTVEIECGAEGAAAAIKTHTNFSGHLNGMKADCLALSLQATARGLAKLAAFMANKGTFQGQKLMSEETWNDFMSDSTTKNLLTFLPTSMVKGGLMQCGLETMKKGMPSHEINAQDRLCHQYREGSFGWMGLGGSVIAFNPDRKIAYSYVPTHMSIVEIFCSKSAEMENIV